MTRQALEDRFRKAAKQVGSYTLGVGPHILRSAFESQCAMVGVKEAVAEFCAGHGGGDRYGYRREVLNPQFVISELRKLQTPSVRDLESEIRNRDERLAKLERVLSIPQIQRALKNLPKATEE